MPTPESARIFMSGLLDRARRSKRKIVFPEGSDPRVRNAACRLAREGLLHPILIGPKPEGAPEGVTFVDPASSPLASKYATIYYERRRSNGITLIESSEIARR